MASKKTATDTTAYVVVKGSVGRHQTGAVITFTENQLQAGHDPKRLVALGAVRPATEQDGEPITFGAGPGSPFPPVPFESVTAAQRAVADAATSPTADDAEAAKPDTA